MLRFVVDFEEGNFGAVVEGSRVGDGRRDLRLGVASAIFGDEN